MFKEVADIKTSDQLHLPVPVAKFETVVAKPSEIQKEMVQELSKRAAEIHSGAVDASVDNMLCVTNDGRKIGLDVRLMNPMLPDDPNSKLNVCVQNVLKIWEDGKDQKLTQLLFCDLSTPKNDGNFNVYDDIRKKLVAAGVPENEIEFIHNADTEAKKAALFSKVRSGDVRILLGSTAKMGAGTNVQSRLVAVHEPLNKHTAHCQGGAAGGVHIAKGGQLLIQNWKFQRGDIFFTRFDNAIGSEQSGNRPAVVLQNDVGNFYSPTLIVATLTSKAAKKYTQPTHCLLVNEFLSVPSIVQAEQIFTVDKSRVLKFLGHLTPEEMSRVDDAVRASLALNPMGSIQRLSPIIRSTAAYAPPEVVDGKPPIYPYTPIKSSFEDAGSVEDMMLYTELEAAVHAMIQRLEYSFTFNPSLLTIPKRKQQVAEILKEAETYIWRIKEEMRCA